MVAPPESNARTASRAFDDDPGQDDPGEDSYNGWRLGDAEADVVYANYGSPPTLTS